MNPPRQPSATAKALLCLPFLLLAPSPLRAQDKQDKKQAAPAAEKKADLKADVKDEAKPAAGQDKKGQSRGPDYVGATVCLSCHQDRESFHKNVHAKAWPKAKGIEFEQSCETCHGPGAKHSSAGGDKTNPDYFAIKNPKTMKASEVSETCLECHSGGQRMHWLGSMHEAKNVSCVNCHSMHDDAVNGGEEPLLSKKTEAETCYQCHAEKKAQIRKSAHMPLVEGKMGCTACHNPHGSSAERLMVKNSITETCYQCHQDKRGPFLWEHPPVRENCVNCHDPHGSQNDYMLVIKPPLLCQRCHIGTSHFASQYDLSQEFVGGARLIGDSCVNCHSKIHGSNHPSGKRFWR